MIKYLASDSKSVITRKIIELIDAVNALQSRIGSGCAPDPYAEQRKWVGKLCKFWDHLDAPKCIDILAKIDDEHLDYPFGASCTKDTENVLFFKHCEPITADDELIYKGE